MILSVKSAAAVPALAVLGAILAGCASTAGADGPGTGPVERGAALAQTHCAACHAISGDGASPASMAPPFRVLRSRYNELSFERRLEGLARDHLEMPRMNLGRSDIEALAAYMDNLPR